MKLNYRSFGAALPALLLGACVSSPKEIAPSSTGTQTTASTAPSSSTPNRGGRTPATIPPPPPPPSFANPTVMNLPGLDGVIGETAEQLIRSFGQPRLDVVEADSRKLQFSGSACVLDIYLYPARPGATPTATHLEARRASDGFEVDRAACAKALRGR